MTTPFFVNHLWQSSSFALLAGVLAFALRRNSAKVRYWVWLSASLKFLVPFALLVSLGSVVPRWDRQAVSVAAPVFPNTLVQIVEPFSPARKATAPAHAPLEWAPVAIGAMWALGFLAITLARCRSWSAVRAAVRAGKPIELSIPVRALITPGVEEPAVVGFLRPVLVLPAQLLEHLNPRQLRAILTHELCHVRRRDNFFAAVHMVVEAMFWFHPLVWWIGARMVEERELACDEEVLRMGWEPAEYVEGILQVCRFYLESPLPCVSGVTGADVKKRLRGILAGNIGHELNGAKKMTLAAIGMAALAAPVLIGVLNAPAIRAQDARAAAPKFEVVSIKPNRSDDRGGNMRPIAGGFSARNLSVNMLIQSAYTVKPWEIFGGPGWLATDGYDIEAKTEGNPTFQEKLAMLRPLLADRFHLKFHREMRQMPIYSLTAAKNGPKLQATAAGVRGFIRPGRGLIEGKGVTMGTLAGFLGGSLGQSVTDNTGVIGGFDIRLEWTPTEVEADYKYDDRPIDPTGPSMFIAIQEQLGLKLEPAKGPVEVFVIDHIERPAGN